MELAKIRLGTTNHSFAHLVTVWRMNYYRCMMGMICIVLL